MNFEPQKFFIGVIDLFSVLLPGALLAFLFKDQLGPLLLGCDAYTQLTDTAAWLAFLFSAYLLGHFVFLLGAWLLDDHLYDRLRRATNSQQIDRLVEGKSLAWEATRTLAGWLIKGSSDEAQRQAIRIRDHYTDPLGATGAVNAFQWCKARLTLANHSEAMATVQRFEADSKFFRSFAVVIFIFAAWKGAQGHIWVILISLPFLGLALWRYIDQRAKSIDQAYWYTIAAEAGDEHGYRQPAMSHAGGVVHRGAGAAAEYLLVQARKHPDDWVLPKGHIEWQEHPKETARREVHEETGITASIEADLGSTMFEADGETVVAQFYLMKSVSEDQASESRVMKWLAFDDAVKKATHRETKRLLVLARDELSKPPPYPPMPSPRAGSPPTR